MSTNTNTNDDDDDDDGDKDDSCKKENKVKEETEQKPMPLVSSSDHDDDDDNDGDSNDDDSNDNNKNNKSNGKRNPAIPTATTTTTKTKTPTFSSSPPSSSSSPSDVVVDELAQAVAATHITTDEDSSSMTTTTTTATGLGLVGTWLKTCKNIIVLSGAGVSCSAGIPDFRSPGTGLYDNLQKYNLPYPEAVFDLRFYQHNPDPFCDLARELWPGLRHSPTLSHSFIALLERKGILLRNYTQNIDGLEVLAGLSPSKLVECHGHFRTASCTNIRCGHRGKNSQTAKDCILHKKQTPRCEKCGSYVKPDIVFFGEGLPDRFHSCLRGDLVKAELLIVMGTSLTVAPVSLIPEMVACRKRVLLNRELVGDFHVHNSTATSDNGNWRVQQDVFEEGDCDDSVLKLCRRLGWHEELLELNKSTRIIPPSEK